MEEIERIKELINEADAIVLGAGTGRFFNMSEEDQERWFLGSTIDFDA